MDHSVIKEPRVTPEQKGMSLSIEKRMNGGYKFFLCLVVFSGFVLFFFLFPWLIDGLLMGYNGP